MKLSFTRHRLVSATVLCGLSLLVMGCPGNSPSNEPAPAGSAICKKIAITKTDKWGTDDEGVYEFDASGRVSRLDGVAIYYDSKGFPLPNALFDVSYDSPIPNGPRDRFRIQLAGTGCRENYELSLTDKRVFSFFVGEFFNTTGYDCSENIDWFVYFEFDAAQNVIKADDYYVSDLNDTHTTITCSYTNKVSPFAGNLFQFYMSNWAGRYGYNSKYLIKHEEGTVLERSKYNQSVIDTYTISTDYTYTFDNQGRISTVTLDHTYRGVTDPNDRVIYRFSYAC
ncbi:hypothetical protein [Spirosoma areae]